VTPHQTVALAFRLFAIWLAIQALGYVPAFFSVGGSGSRHAYISFMLALNAVIILVLWVFPRIVVGKLLPSAEPQSQPPPTPDTLLSVGCTLIGLWTLTNTVPRLAFYLYLTKSTNDRWWLVPEDLSDIVKLFIAIWLVLGGRGIGKIFRWAQYAGIRKDL
jgi:hypothetical protein